MNALRAPDPEETDLALATVLIAEAILRLRLDPPISHSDLKASLAEVLAENATTIRLVPVAPRAALVRPAIADAAAGMQRGSGVVADATQPAIRRGRRP